MFFGAIWDKSAYIWCNFSTMIFLKIEAGTPSYNGAIWDEFSEHQSSKKAPYSRLKFYFFGANKVYILHFMKFQRKSQMTSSILTDSLSEVFNRTRLHTKRI